MNTATIGLPVPGARYGLNGELYEVTRIDDGYIRFRGVQLQRDRVIAVADFANQLKSGTLVLKVNAPVAISNAPLTLNMPEGVRAAYERRLAYVQGIYREFRGACPPSCTEKVIPAVATQIGDTRPPNFSSVYRWHKRFIEAGANPMALVPAQAQTLTRKSRLPEEVTALMNNYIKAEYLHSTRPPAQRVYELFTAELGANNLNRPQDQQLPVPSRQAFFRAVWDLDPYVVDMTRHGRKTARKRHRHGKSIHPATRIGERVEADSHLMDVQVVDAVGHVIGRPWLCALLDVCTRCVVGWEISFTPPCGAKVLRALRHAMSDASGRIYACAPEELVLDNGREFQNTVLQTVAGTYGVRLRYVQPGSPNEKPHIERFFGTLNTQLVHMMPGTTRSNPSDRGEYDSEAHATLTLDEVRERFAFWLDSVYHQSVHETLAMPPCEMWRVTSELDAPTTYPDSDLQLNCRSMTRRTIAGGRVSFDTLYWAGPSLPDVAARLAGREDFRTEVYYDESDLSVVWVQDPDDRALLYRAEAVNPAYQNGLSLFEHRLLKDIARPQKQRFNTQDLLHAKATLYRQLQADSKTARKQRARAAAQTSPDTVDDDAVTPLPHATGASSEPRSKRLPAAPRKQTPAPATRPDAARGDDLVVGESSDLSGFVLE